VNTLSTLSLSTLSPFISWGIHPAQTSSLLSGTHISKGAIIHSGISVDQRIAAHVGEETPQSGIVLACEQPR
jgi:hypothetical protein